MPDDHINQVDPERLQVSRGVSQVVKQAASILQQELADHSDRASTMQQNYASTKRVDPNEFKALSDRVRQDVHDLIAMAGEMFGELRTDEVQSLVSRMATDAHDVVDTTMNLIENTPAAAGTFARLGFTTPTPPGPASASADPPKSNPGPDTGGEPPLSST
ncbi:hypothetical protein ACFC09_18940 [Streptomyces sp. NPDC056161]|uniref:hypothetical protein n=1 Tax=Streptomyces sp. NPDC056161 TaxID=3345732 RepID=UPI0035E1ED36